MKKFLLSAVVIAVALTACETVIPPKPQPPAVVTPTPTTPDDTARQTDIQNLLSATLPFPVGQPQEPTKVGTPLTSNDIINGNKFICTTQHYTAAQNYERFAVINPNAGVLFPGAIIQGRSVSDKGSFDPVRAARGPGDVTLTIASGNNESVTQHVSTVTLPTVTQAMNDILARYSAGTPAKFDLEISSVHSLKEFMFNLKASVNWSAEISGKITFHTDKNYNRVMVKLSQEYFTMAFTGPQSATEFFAPSVTAQTLAPYTGEYNPMVYVDSITYGRMFVLLYESEADSTTLTAAIHAKFGLWQAKAGVDMDSTYKKVLENSQVSAFALGGGADDSVAASTGNVDDIMKYLTKGASFDQAHPGAPLSATMRYLSDATSVRLYFYTDYDVRDCNVEFTGADTSNFTLKTPNGLGTSKVCSSSKDHCSMFYWDLKVDLIDGTEGDGVPIRTWTWSQRTREQATRMCAGGLRADITDFPFAGIPNKANYQLHFHGDVYEVAGSNASSDKYVGRFEKNLSYDSSLNQWNLTFASDSPVMNGSCNSADLSYYMYLN